MILRGGSEGVKDLIPPAAGKRSGIVLTTGGCTVVDTSANNPMIEGFILAAYVS